MGHKLGSFPRIRRYQHFTFYVGDTSFCSESHRRRRHFTILSVALWSHWYCKSLFASLLSPKTKSYLCFHLHFFFASIFQFFYSLAEFPFASPPPPIELYLCDWLFMYAPALKTGFMNSSCNKAFTPLSTLFVTDIYSFAFSSLFLCFT